MIRMKIKTRIISYVFLSSFIVITLFSSFVYSEMKELLMKTLDSKITTIISGLKEQMEPQNAKPKDILKHKEYEGVYVLISGEEASYSSVEAEENLPPGSAQTSFSEELTPLNSKDKETKMYRFKRINTEIDGKTYQVTAGVPIEGIQDELDDLYLNLFLATVAALLAVGGMGILISNTILKPVKNIIASADTINSRNLSLRIDTPTMKDEIYELTTTLNSLFNRLERAFNMQKEFIANISHEIKTPLTVLNLTTDEALQSDELSSRETDYLIKINNSLNRVNKLVKDIINLSYIETNQLQTVEKVNLLEITDEILENLADMTDVKGLKIDLAHSGRCTADGDERLLYSALMNLIHNAIKYSPQGGNLKISIKDMHGKTEYRISNTCAGIPDESLERLFDRFYRVEKSRSRDYGGAGLGLSIVKEIVTKHGGTITVSKPDTNSLCFTLLL